eukprot:gene11217-4039_t
MSVESNWKNVLAGAGSGFCLTMVGHPFDVVKVRLQTSNEFKGVIDCVRKTLTKEGVVGFYKGVTSPLLSTSLMNSIVFSSYTFAKNQQKKKNFKNIFLSGSFAGFVSSLFVTPFERLKILTQIQYTSTYKGPLSLGKMIFKEEGFKGIYRGITSNILRDTVGRGVYFSTYEYLKSNNLGVIFSGGISGMMTWLVIIPLDTVKSKIQSETKNKIGIITIIKSQKSFKHLYRGTLPVLIRSFPANAAGFYGYEYIMKILKNNE